MKELKGEKYIYLAMAYLLAKNNNGKAIIGNDNGMIGGYNFYRSFSITEYEGQTILNETKTTKSFTDFSRSFFVVNEIGNRPYIYDYVNECGDNLSNKWEH